jgi:hypothetical protein
MNGAECNDTTMRARCVVSLMQMSRSHASAWYVWLFQTPVNENGCMLKYAQVYGRAATVGICLLAAALSASIAASRQQCNHAAAVAVVFRLLLLLLLPA